MTVSELQSPAWVNGSWEPIERAVLAHNDLGALQGAVIVERLRTVDNKPLDVELHLRRLVAGLEFLGVRLPSSLDVASIVLQCACRGSEVFEDDHCVVLIATPGLISGGEPTLIVHPAPMPWPRLRAWYRDGQPIVTADSRNVPSECWPIQLKTRSRLHYYLADRQAKLAAKEAGHREPDFAGGVLCNTSGYLTETSTANLLLVEPGKLVSPLASSILDGISLKRTLRLAKQLQIPVEQAEISPGRAKAADGIILCGSLGCIWAAASLDDHSFSPADQCDVFTRLQAAWRDDIGLDFVAQAIRQSE